MKLNLSKQNYAIFVVASVVFLALAFWMIYFIPMNMDEVINYHPLACALHPLSAYNGFREPCNNFYDITLPFGLTYQRAYLYAGGLSSFLYATIHHVFPNMHTPFFYGLCVYVLFCALLARLTAKPWMSFFLFLPFFPALYQFIHDTGPIKVASLVFVLTPFIYRWAIGQKIPMQIMAGVGLGILWVLAFEDKPFFLYLLLPLAFFTLAFVADTHKNFISYFTYFRKSMRSKFIGLLGDKNMAPWFLGGLGIIAAIGIGLISFSTVHSRHYGDVYYFLLIGGSAAKFAILDVLRNLISYITVWPSFAHRVYDMPIYKMAIIAIPTLVFYAYVFFAYRGIAPMAKCPPLRVRLLLWAAGAFLILSLSRTLWAGHHYIFAYFPLMILFAEIVVHAKKTMRYKLIAGYLGLNILSAVMLMGVPPQIASAWERGRILDYFNQPKISRHALINYTSWGENYVQGNYYIHALYAPPDALVTFIAPWNRMDAERLLAIASKTQRVIYNICVKTDTDCTAKSMAKIAGNGMRFEEVNLGLTQWLVLKAQ